MDFNTSDITTSDIDISLILNSNAHPYQQQTECRTATDARQAIKCLRTLGVGIDKVAVHIHGEVREPNDMDGFNIRTSCRVTKLGRKFVTAIVDGTRLQLRPVSGYNPGRIIVSWSTL